MLYSTMRQEVYFINTFSYATLSNTFHKIELGDNNQPGFLTQLL